MSRVARAFQLHHEQARTRADRPARRGGLSEPGIIERLNAVPLTAARRDGQTGGLLANVDPNHPLRLTKPS